MSLPAKRHALFSLYCAVLLLFASALLNAQNPTTFSGTLADGSTYLIEVPPAWNGTLLLYSHGYVPPGSPNPAQDVGDPLTRFFLLSNGYALAGSSYASTGWAIDQALVDQIGVLDTFASLVGQPLRTIAWGHSLGGIITAGLIQRHPQRFSAALPMCGVLAGGIGTWNQALDGQFVFATLLAGGTGLQMVHITDPLTNLQIAEGALALAQSTPQGRARIALAAAMGDTPGWFTPLSPEPAATDFDGQEANQFLWFQQIDWPFVFAFRAELEFRAGGNPSWNTGINYRKQLARSANRNEVIALYKEAGLDLNADLAFLEHAPRIAADPGAAAYLNRNITFNGEISIPVLTMHTIGDGLVVVEDEQAYASAVRDEGNNSLLRETFVQRAGHCAFTPAETLTALQKLSFRLTTGRWPAINANALNEAAAKFGPTFNVFAAGGNIVPVAPAFLNFQPPVFLRPFDAATGP